MSKEQWLRVLRWVGFIPAAFVAATIVRILNYMGAAQVGIYPEEGGLLFAVFTTYSDVVESAALVAAGALVAPAGRPIVATVLATLQSGFWVGLLSVELATNRILGSSQRPGALMVIIGSVLGAIYIHQEEKKKETDVGS